MHYDGCTAAAICIQHPPYHERTARPASNRPQKFYRLTVVLLSREHIRLARRKRGGPRLLLTSNPTECCLWSNTEVILCLVVSSETDKFQPAALLKAWSVPFDILQLDQQHLDTSYLFRRMGQIRYGTVIWLADPSSYSQPDLLALEEATRAGTGLMVVGSRFLDAALAKLLGLKFKDLYTSTNNLQVAHEHYITRGMATGETATFGQGHDYSERIWVESTSAEVLIAQDKHPVLTVNHVGLESSALWLGSPNLSVLCDSAPWRNLFFRSLVWSLGYIVVPTVDYAHRVIFELDDWGTADKGFLSYWRYLEPTEETISRGPHKAVATKSCRRKRRSQHRIRESTNEEGGVAMGSEI